VKLAEETRRPETNSRAKTRAGPAYYHPKEPKLRSGRKVAKAATAAHKGDQASQHAGVTGSHSAEKTYYNPQKKPKTQDGSVELAENPDTSESPKRIAAQEKSPKSAGSPNRISLLERGSAVGVAEDDTSQLRIPVVSNVVPMGTIPEEEDDRIDGGPQPISSMAQSSQTLGDFWERDPRVYADYGERDYITEYEDAMMNLIEASAAGRPSDFRYVFMLSTASIFRVSMCGGFFYYLWTVCGFSSRDPRKARIYPRAEKYQNDPEKNYSHYNIRIVPRGPRSILQKTIAIYTISGAAIPISTRSVRKVLRKLLRVF